MNSQIVTAQNNLATQVIQFVHESWERIVINYEMQREAGGWIVDYRAFYISSINGDFVKNSIQLLPDEVDKGFIELSDVMGRLNGHRWHTCDLVIDKDGKYNFKFSYDPPKRLNGVFDDVSMGRFDRYLETYKVERRASSMG